MRRARWTARDDRAETFGMISRFVLSSPCTHHGGALAMGGSCEDGAPEFEELSGSSRGDGLRAVDPGPTVATATAGQATCLDQVAVAGSLSWPLVCGGRLKCE